MSSSRRPDTSHTDPRAPLVFNVAALSRRPGTVRAENRTVPAPAGLRTPMAQIPEGAELALAVLLESVTEGVLVTATARAPLAAECARCLEPVRRSIDVECQELFSYEHSGGDREEDGYSLDGDLLDLEPALRDVLVLALPLAPRCTDDCPGLCPECGARLAVAGPWHRHDSIIDSRWAGLRRFQPHAEPNGAHPPGARDNARDKENGHGSP